MLISFISYSVRLLKPNRCDQSDALWKSISDILWKIGDKKKAVIALPQEKAYVPHSIAYFQDSVTEKVINQSVLGFLFLNFFIFICFQLKRLLLVFSSLCFI